MFSFIRHDFCLNRPALPIDFGATTSPRPGVTRRNVTLSAAAALGLIGGACSSGVETTEVSQTEPVSDVAASSQPLNVLSTRLWSKPNIEVCWESVDWPEEQEWTREAVRRTWERWTNATFTGWKSCSATAAASSAIHIAVRNERPHVTAVGNALAGKKDGMVLNFEFNGPGYHEFCVSPQTNRRYCVERFVPYVFGQALGFAHEQNRPDTPDDCKMPEGPNGDTTVGAWDITSIMNACNPRWLNDGELSVTDIEGARRFYGQTLGPEQQFLALDLQGDGRDHIVQTYRGWRSTASCASTNPSAPWECKEQESTVVDWGTQEQRFLKGDFNGDGRDDTVQVYRKATSIPRCLSTGTRWSCSQTPVLFQDWGTAEQRFLAADFTGDGRTDLLQVYRGARTIPRCAATDKGWTCSDPAAVIYDSGSPEQVFLTGDVNGDRKADVIQAFRGWQRLPICLSDSMRWRCASAPAHLVDSGSAEQEFHVGDVNGDGRSDVIVTYRGWPFMTQCIASGSVSHLSWNCVDAPANVVDSGSPEQQFLTGDFDGDGRTDVVQTYRGWESFPVCLSRPTGWSCSTPPAWFGGWPSDEHRFMTADVNKDGKTDIVSVYRGADMYPVCLSTGGGWDCHYANARIIDIGEY